MSPSPVGWRVLAAGTALYLAVVVGLVGFSVVTAAAAPPPCLPGTGAGGPVLSELTAEQQANARTVTDVGVGAGVGFPGVAIALMTAMTESSLINVGHGDAAGPDSRGLFQQRDSWGPESVRRDPAGASSLFYAALLAVNGWQTMPPHLAAQTVQRSAYPDGSNYLAHRQFGVDLATALLGTTGAGGTGGAAAGVQIGVATDDWAGYTARTGHTGGIAHRYRRFGDGGLVGPVETDLAASGRTLYLNWYPDGARWASVAGGQHDGLLRDAAAQVKTLPRPPMIGFSHEPEDDLGRLGTPADFAAATRHVIDTFRAEDAEATWVFPVMGFDGHQHLYAELWPGDGYIDVLAADPYNWGPRTGPWRSWAETVRPFYDWAVATHPGVPLMLGEFGTEENPDDPQAKADWIAAIPAALAEFPALVAIVYFDQLHTNRDGSTWDWRLTSSPPALSAWIALLGAVGSCTGVPAGAPGQGGQPTEHIPCAAGVDRGIATGPGGVPIRLCEFGGIVVDTTLAPHLAGLLAAASAAGLDLGGGGWRSHQAQIELRRRHCADVWTTPPSRCTPPTAIPGTSQHEWGLAVDFDDGGRGLTRSSPAFAWLTANADTYGLINLPSEPWHWSSNGK